MSYVLGLALKMYKLFHFFNFILSIIFPHTEAEMSTNLALSCLVIKRKSLTLSVTRIIVCINYQKKKKTSVFKRSIYFSHIESLFFPPRALVKKWHPGPLLQHWFLGKNIRESGQYRSQASANSPLTQTLALPSSGLISRYGSPGMRSNPISFVWENKISCTIKFIYPQINKSIKTDIKEIQLTNLNIIESLVEPQICWTWNFLGERCVESAAGNTRMLSNSAQPLMKTIQALSLIWKGVLFHSISFIMRLFRQISKGAWFTYFKLNSLMI